ncbi:fibronectin type III domain-containing protein [Brevibacillus laterosporus]|uniref:fibronectin type III domain-containing protein n=1 Tax=Brevibacillus laterosporus TaxID=1465 RepID=UPI001443EBBC|nr:fibronectin type III domain-containing protein [Brevibacillus laterosporus]NKQ22346.1 fibronectin type III domain-containing protein [Brevibacillus laterosporus]WNX33484.1 fibronectin type III domain-containing protein [Brevibacillus laterosporus]
MYNNFRKWTAGLLIITLCISILPGGEVIALEQTDQAIPLGPTTSQMEQRETEVILQPAKEKTPSSDPSSLATSETTALSENKDSTVEQKSEKESGIEPDQEKQENQGNQQKQQTQEPQTNSELISIPGDESSVSSQLTQENEVTLEKETVEKILQEQETKQAVTISLTSERTLPQEELDPSKLIEIEKSMYEAAAPEITYNDNQYRGQLVKGKYFATVLDKDDQKTVILSIEYSGNIERSPLTLEHFELGDEQPTNQPKVSLRKKRSILEDEEPPTRPGLLKAFETDDQKMVINWTGSKSNVALAGYEIYRNGKRIAITKTTTFTDSDKDPLVYSYVVRAIDIAGRRSEPSNVAVPIPYKKSVQIYKKERFYDDSSCAIREESAFREAPSRITYQDKDNYSGYVKKDSYILIGCGGKNEDKYADIDVIYKGEVYRSLHELTTKPVNLVASSVSENEVTLTWDPVVKPNDPILSYTVIRNGENPKNVSQNKYIDKNVQPGMQYHYQVVVIFESLTVSLLSDELKVQIPGTVTNPQLILSTNVLQESSQNDGSIATPLSVYLKQGVFAKDLSSGITIENLPEGLTVSTKRDSDNQITIQLNGKAKVHDKPVDNLILKIDKNCIVGATAETKSGAFTIAFRENNIAALYEYEYNEQNQLIAIKKDGTVIIRYLYDENGNLLTKKIVQE